MRRFCRGGTGPCGGPYTTLERAGHYPGSLGKYRDTQRPSGALPSSAHTIAKQKATQYTVSIGHKYESFAAPDKRQRRAVGSEFREAQREEEA